MKSLADRLFLKPGMAAAIINAPDGVDAQDAGHKERSGSGPYIQVLIVP